MMGVKEMFMSRNGREIVYEIVFQNEQMAQTAKEAMKNNMARMLPFGMDKMVEEIEVEQQGEKIIQKFIMKSEKLAECFFTLMKAMQGDQNG